MASNSLQFPTGGKEKPLWKGADLKSLRDKHAAAYFLVLICLLFTVDLCTLLKLTDQTLCPLGIAVLKKKDRPCSLPLWNEAMEQIDMCTY